VSFCGGDVLDETAKQALDDAVTRGNATLRQFEKTVSQ
jgi:hypothetical protein